MKNNRKLVTAEEVEYWLGSDSELDEAIATLVDLANGDYHPKTFKQDVIDINKDK